MNTDAARTASMFAVRGKVTQLLLLLALSAATGTVSAVQRVPPPDLSTLGACAEAPELACYTAADARKLNESIRRSATISGSVTPAFATTVVCAFVEDTSAVCWQYSAKARAFVKVGDWQT